MKTTRVSDRYGCYIAQHDEYKTQCYCEHCGHYLGDKDFTHPAGKEHVFDEESRFCPRCGKPLYGDASDYKEPGTGLEELIATIEEELAMSTSEIYNCKNGYRIATDVWYIWQWFNEYKEVLRGERDGCD